MKTATRILALMLLPYGYSNAAVTVYQQPAAASGGLIQSSWRAPDGSDYDQFVWENFTLQSSTEITTIDWRGGFMPERVGWGGAVLDFTVGIYASIPGGAQPDVVSAPLMEFSTGGNANQTLAGTFGGTTMFDYSFTLPTSFQAVGGTKYWLQIKADQGGSVPDWGLALGTAGNGIHFEWYDFGSAGYRNGLGDTAFALGAVPEPASVGFVAALCALGFAAFTRRSSSRKHTQRRSE